MRAALVLGIVLLAPACSKPETTGSSEPAPAAPAAAPEATAAPAVAATGAPEAGATSAEKTYTMNGKIVSRDGAKGTVTVDHEEIPGLMAAMQMTYEVRGTDVANLPADGSRITSTLHEQGGDYWVTDVKPRS
jgi:Cu/Ag efflux protein CusF